MDNCKGCIYRTITLVFDRFDLQEVIKPACGINPGKPIIIEEDRIACKEFKSE